MLQKQKQGKQSSVQQTSARQSAQILMNEDMVQFSNKMSSCNYTSQRYRKRSVVNTNPFKHQLSSEFSTPLFINQSSRELPKTSEYKHDLTVNFSRLNVNKRNRNTSFTKRSFMNSTEKPKEEEGNQIFKESAKSFSQQKPSRSKFTNLLSGKGLQGWLNKALLDVSTQQFDEKQENSALKKLEIDKNSLITKRVKPQIVQRIYRCLFVYSVGFNDFLVQSCPTPALKQVFWKVYARLLQYCSKGKFETMIGQIERDKSKKLQEMKTQIHKRQKLLDQNEERNEEKNAKLFKDLKILEEENKNLQTQKNIIENDYHEAQQCFNQQIMLRLKYENKINQIHGVYEEIRGKHESLKEKLSKTLQKCESLDKENKQKSSTIAYLTGELKDRQTTIQVMQKHKELQISNTEKLQEKLRNLTQDFFKAKTQIEGQNSKFLEKERMIKQLQLRLDSAVQAQRTTLKSLKNEASEQRKLIQENKILSKSLEDQNTKINSIVGQSQDKKKYIAQTEANYHLEKEKVKKLQQELEKYPSTIRDLQKNLQRIQTQIEIERNKNQNISEDLSSCYENIKEMKKNHNQTQQQLQQYMKKSDLLEEMLEQKGKQNEDNSQKLQEMKKKNEKLYNQNKSFQSRINIIQESYAAQNKVQVQKYKLVENQKEYYEKKYDEYKSNYETLDKEYLKLKQQHDNIFNEYKNQKFERKNLDVAYKQALTVMEQEHQHIKGLTINISEMNENQSSLDREMKNANYLNEEKSKQLEKDVKFWKENSQKLESQINQKKEYIHLMKYEDLYSNMIKLDHKYTQSKRQNLQRQEQLKTNIRKHEERESKTKEKQNSLKSAFDKKQQEYKAFIQNKNKEIDYLKEKKQHLENEIIEKNNSYEIKNTQKVALEDKLIQVQKDYIKKIAEKNKNIESLNSYILQTKKGNNGSSIKNSPKNSSIHSGFEQNSKGQENQTLKVLRQENQRYKEAVKGLQEQIKQLLKDKVDLEEIKKKQNKNKNTPKNDKNNGEQENEDLEGEPEEKRKVKYENLSWKHKQNNEGKKKSNEKEDNEQLFSQQSSDKLNPIEKKQSTVKRDLIKNKIRGAYLYYNKK